jgi:hypothetical protein
MSTFPMIGLRAGILTAALASSLAVAPAAFAADQSFNDADVVIRGGDTVAVATCLNWAKTYAGYNEEERKRHEKVRVVQANKCENTADALGGDVTLKKVDVTVAQKGRTRAAKNDASVEISGGDAVAVAACINVLNGGTDVEQTNKCSNTAIATGGSVKLVHTDITIKQA